MKQAHNPSACTLILFALLLMFNLISIHGNIHCSTSGQEETEFGTALFCIAESPQPQNITRTGNTQVLSEGRNTDQRQHQSLLCVLTTAQCPQCCRPQHSTRFPPRAESSLSEGRIQPLQGQNPASSRAESSCSEGGSTILTGFAWSTGCNSLLGVQLQPARD